MNPGVREFLSAVVADTMAAACGALSVPCSALARTLKILQ